MLNFKLEYIFTAYINYIQIYNDFYTNFIHGYGKSYSILSFLSSSRRIREGKCFYSRKPERVKAEEKEVSS